MVAINQSSSNDFSQAEKFESTPLTLYLLAKVEKSERHNMSSLWLSLSGQPAF